MASLSVAFLYSFWVVLSVLLCDSFILPVAICPTENNHIVVHGAYKRQRLTSGTVCVSLRAFCFWFF